ncbi:RNB domain-containing ribonuclease [Sphingomonas suaedae]|uniref:RNB domain-containing ribonuclease n=1 Tax=Sphingomonas suaedae TaxID=2599297 RepID=A0A518RGW0_9SPHN|nr:RNB domain-containing ribonuclease [Sphingomonas suaedae]QDX26692.1 RNB domain-containing ribonuclease [Sphingomonas suaedae]
MKTIADPSHALSRGLQSIRTEFQVPRAFPPQVKAAADSAARRVPGDHADWTDRHFVTLDPASATDLDQAFAIEEAGRDLILHYAIADVAWFVDEDGPINAEAWTRGETVYLPDGKAGLYPPILSEGAASLLPGGPRPAVVFTIRIDAEGAVRLDAATRAVIRNRAKLAYETVREGDLPTGFTQLTTRLIRAEAARGAARVDPPEQEVGAGADGRLALIFRDRHPSEDQNASLSLTCNMAVADALIAHNTGLFRVMAEPDSGAVARLRITARALGIDWPATATLTQFERTLNPAAPRDAALMLAIRRAGNGAAYRAFDPDETPWHAAVAAPYAHATAPLRRLADRYVVQAALAVANGRVVPDHVEAAFARLPKVMARADGRAARIDNAVIAMAEAVTLAGREGERFDAVVTDIGERGASVQLCGVPVTARIDAAGLTPGDALNLVLIETDTVGRRIAFDRLS